MCFCMRFKSKKWDSFWGDKFILLTKVLLIVMLGVIFTPLQPAKAQAPELFQEIQSIPTIGAAGWETFIIDSQIYLVVANSRNALYSYNVDSKIYRWNGNNFIEFQTIPTHLALDWEYFMIGNNHYLAVANGGTARNSRDIDSIIYQWDGSSFVAFQSIPTRGAADWEFFTIGSDHYLAVANYQGNNGHRTDSEIYRWNGIEFESFQSIPTISGSGWEHLQIGEEHFLAIAQTWDFNYNINSKIYRWNGNNFIEFQTIPTSGANSWESFMIDNNHYLAIANVGSSTTPTHSKIYQWNGTNFTEFQSITTNYAMSWRFFTIGNDHYLATANRQNGSNYNIDSIIYQWSGTNFVESESIPTQGATEWEYFAIGSEPYLAVANSRDGTTYNVNSKIYHWASSTPPTITLIEPDGVNDTVTDSFTITWNDEYPNGNATVSLYYDTNNSGEDGTLIVSGLSEDDEGAGDSYVWDTSAVEGGDYYIYAVIDDGVNTPVVDYSQGAVTVYKAPVCMIQDDFASSQLDPAWTVEPKNHGTYSLTANPGHLRVQQTKNGKNGWNNSLRLYRSFVNDTDWTMEFYVDYGSGFHSTGTGQGRQQYVYIRMADGAYDSGPNMVWYRDKDCCSSPSRNRVGTRIAEPGVTQSSVDISPGNDKFYVRMSRSGNDVSIEYKHPEDADYTVVQTHTFQGELSATGWVYLMSTSHASEDSYADYDYIEVCSQPATTPPSTLTIVKEIEPGQDGEFGFTSDIAGLERFTLTHQAATPATTVTAGTYTIQEDVVNLPGGVGYWALLTVSCVDGANNTYLAGSPINHGVQIELDRDNYTAHLAVPAGINLTCTFFNEWPSFDPGTTDSPIQRVYLPLMIK